MSDNPYQSPAAEITGAALVPVFSSRRYLWTVCYALAISFFGSWVIDFWLVHTDATPDKDLGIATSKLTLADQVLWSLIIAVLWGVISLPLAGAAAVIHWRLDCRQARPKKSSD